MAIMAYTPWRYGIPRIDRHTPGTLNPTEIEFALRDLVGKPYDATTFPYELIGVLNASKMTVSRLKSGATNKARQPGDVLWQKHFFFRAVSPGVDVGAVGDALAADPLTTKNKPRFIMVTDGKHVHVRDLKFNDTENVAFDRLDEKSDFLLPLAGYERRAVVEEHPADIKAAKKLKKLYDAILAANPTWSGGHHTHELNVLMTRLLFCFYAEKTGIFDIADVFTNTVTQQTYQDPAGVAPLLDRLFRIMNTEENVRPKNTPAIEGKFPYVNGSLFGDTVAIPQFDLTARRQLLECGDLDWTHINPDIFGSMIQTISQDGTRSDLGMHYTSVPNIMKVLQPLFLDNLNESYEKAKDSVPRLEALLSRLSKIRVFDPACGSGNFLVIAYKALRELETRILLRLGEISPNAPLRLSGISLRNFYGIDIVDFACETTKLSLWIAEHQTNSTFRKIFGTARPVLPLPKITTICRDNALTRDWLQVCPTDDTYETYICGNPPYAGYQTRTQGQAHELEHAIGSYTTQFKSMDYICAWFVLAARYANQTAAEFAFVSTNSICQGEQVSMLWPVLFSLGVHVTFAYTPFKWANSASNNAGVLCVVVGFANRAPRAGRLIDGDRQRSVPTIGPYLIPDAARTIVLPRRRPISNVPPLVLGSNPTDGGRLLLSPTERASLLQSYPGSAKFIRRYIGSKDAINGIERYCLWIEDEDLDEASSIPPIRQRIAGVAAARLESPSLEIRESAAFPHRFRRRPAVASAALVFPSVCSERRHYLTIDSIGSDTIVSNTAFAVYDPPTYLLALMSSRMHLLWARTVGGGLEGRIRYSNTLVYNTFPVSELSEDQKQALSDHSVAILRARGRYPGKSLAWLYNPESMPSELLNVHRDNDLFVEEHLYGRKYRDDLHRIESMFGLYARASVREDTPLPLEETDTESVEIA